MFKRLLWLVVLASVLHGCGVTVEKVATGPVTIKEKLTVTASRDWNTFSNHPAITVPVWTVNGFSVDSLQFFVGIKDGEPVVKPAANSAAAKDPTPRTFRKHHKPHEIVALYQSWLTANGSMFTLDKLQPRSFLQSDGFQFDFTVVRKGDDVKVSGRGYGTVIDEQLYVILYTATKLVFFDKSLAEVEKIASTATLKR